MASPMQSSDGAATRQLLVRRMWTSTVTIGLVLTAAAAISAIFFGSTVPASAIILGVTMVGSVLSWANVDRFDRPVLERNA